MRNNQKSNEVYTKQFALIAFISATAFKVAMLPQYLSIYAGRNAWLAMLIMMLTELCTLGVIFGIVSRVSLLDSAIPKPAKCVFCLLILFSCFVKGAVLTTEFTSYITSTLFDNSSLLYVLLALLPCLIYLSFKGANTIARVSELLFWIIAVAFLFNVLFARIDGALDNLLPVEETGKIAVALDKHFIWFGDFTPFLFMKIIPSPKKSRPFSFISISAMILCPVALVFLFTYMYGGGATMTGNVFSKIAIFNKLSFVLGNLEFPTVCAWICMAVVRLGLLLYAIVSCANYFFDKKAPVAIICGIILGVIIQFGMRNLLNSYSFATGVVRYFVCAIEYLVPCLAYILVRIYSPKIVETPPLTDKPQSNVPSPSLNNLKEKI